MAKFLLIGNWKMNKTRTELAAFFGNLKEKCGTIQPSSNVQVKIAAPYLLLDRALEHGRDLGVEVGAQNLHWEASGAFTGEISVGMLKEAGINFSLIGHSERRQYYNETDDTCAKKIRAALAGGITPVFCVGETLQERERGETSKVISRQLFAGLTGLDKGSKIVIAYEPVWAIGTGLAATAAQAQEVHAQIRKELAGFFGASHGAAIPLLYGGSMTPANTHELLSQNDIDGGLIGGASLKADSLGEMFQIAQRLP